MFSGSEDGDDLEDDDLSAALATAGDANANADVEMLRASQGRSRRRGGGGGASKARRRNGGAGGGGGGASGGGGTGAGASATGAVRRAEYTVTMRDETLLQDTSDDVEGGGAAPTSLRAMRDAYVSGGSTAECPLCYVGFMTNGGRNETEMELELRTGTEELLGVGFPFDWVVKYVQRYHEHVMCEELNPRPEPWTERQVRAHLEHHVRNVDVMLENDIQELRAFQQHVGGTVARGASCNPQIGRLYLDTIKLKYTLMSKDRTKMARTRGPLP